MGLFASVKKEKGKKIFIFVHYDFSPLLLPPFPENIIRNTRFTFSMEGGGERKVSMWCEKERGGRKERELTSADDLTKN